MRRFALHPTSLCVRSARIVPPWALLLAISFGYATAQEHVWSKHIQEGQRLQALGRYSDAKDIVFVNAGEKEASGFPMISDQ
ncbi:MAG TPA: hypothetical protein VEX68_19925 [Bryobacteraceae bacterium]|nr:hypothetical protein [Bryobacteraceae bacterium]